MIRFLARLVAVLAALATSAFAADLPFVPGEPAATTKAAPAARLRLAAKATGPRLHLAPVAEAELESVRAANRRAPGKRLAIGVDRALAEPALAPEWSAVEGGHAARLAIASPDAAAMRLAIDLLGVPADVELVFFGSGEPGRLLGPVRVGDIRDRTLAWWSPATEGAEQTVEVFAPAGVDPALAAVRIARVSHLFASPASGFAKRTADIGDSGSCNVDIKCIVSPSQAFLNVRNSVAKMLFTDGGFTSLCTGTMLNDANPTNQVPWFYGANHCFENESPPYKTAAQMQAVASTLNTYWFFEAVACGSLAAPPFTQFSGGATFLYNSQPRDVLFLRLNEGPPAGSFLAGWDPNPMQAGSNVIGIHHPQGDLKKVSQGTMQRFSTAFTGSTANGFIEILWQSGTTEGGSSGSGVFTYDGADYLFRGGLWGGTALCTNPQGTDNYSRFDQVYQALAGYLGGNTPTLDYTDLWWNAAESGWGLNLTQHASGQIFGVWYTYAAGGRPQWIVMPGGTWTNSTTFTGTLYLTSGPPFTTGFIASQVKVNNVGSATLTFFDANNGSFAYTVNGVSGVKAITRQPF